MMTTMAKIVTINMTMKMEMKMKVKTGMTLNVWVVGHQSDHI